MIALYPEGAYVLEDGRVVLNDAKAPKTFQMDTNQTLPDCRAVKNTRAYTVLSSHNQSQSDTDLQLRFDFLASHDITYVGIILTALASGLTAFPMPYILTNCHNSLCAVGGTINEDDHAFGLSAAKKFGGVYVPAHEAVIHQYMREMYAGAGKMILGSDSHTRYGAFGTLAIGEGGGELAKQLLGRTYDIKRPEVVGVRLTGKLPFGVGPQDVALAMIKAVFDNGFVKNRILEFFGPGVANLSMEERIGIDVMTTESACLSSIWEVDEKTKAYLDMHGRSDAYTPFKRKGVAFYERYMEIDLSKIEPMIALPFHPANVYTIREVNSNTKEIVQSVNAKAKGLFSAGVDFDLGRCVTDGRLRATQSVIAGCSGGTFENICAAADILKGEHIGDGELALNVYPASMPIYKELVNNGVFSSLIDSGAVIKTAFCGPCFGAGDVPRNNAFSIRHTTRNFPNREGSKPGEGQIACVALMDARSIAATSLNGGYLLGADETAYTPSKYSYHFDRTLYEKRVYDGAGRADAKEALRFGPNIVQWPEMEQMRDNLLLKVCASLLDPVTTTDELIPSGETSSLRSNPVRLAQFALSRKDPQYVPRTKELNVKINSWQNDSTKGEITEALQALEISAQTPLSLSVGSCVFAKKPGDGSAREQAASCQKVLGTLANVAWEYATKRYHSNLINWGIVPFVWEGGELANGDWLYVSDIKRKILDGICAFDALLLSEGKVTPITLRMAQLTQEERAILTKGCLINYYHDETRA